MGKGDKPRPVNRAAWDGAEYWRGLARRKAEERKNKGVRHDKA